jgi:hypothetical protein
MGKGTMAVSTLAGVALAQFLRVSAFVHLAGVPDHPHCGGGQCWDWHGNEQGKNTLFAWHVWTHILACNHHSIITNHQSSQQQQQQQQQQF